ncbi:hypothetical protein HOY82DRAFT_173366 [Tuber indicum]|nr:hypothetical protein HOY82DRAFT_173366 [Tuber indicum]
MAALCANCTVLVPVVGCHSYLPPSNAAGTRHQLSRTVPNMVPYYQFSYLPLPHVFHMSISQYGTVQYRQSSLSQYSAPLHSRVRTPPSQKVRSNPARKHCGAETVKCNRLIRPAWQSQPMTQPQYRIRGILATADSPGWRSHGRIQIPVSHSSRLF